VIDLEHIAIVKQVFWSKLTKLYVMQNSSPHRILGRVSKPRSRSRKPNVAGKINPKSYSEKLKEQTSVENSV
jgi:hypothetical protein